jgi:hypothetical protein
MGLFGKKRLITQEQTQNALNHIYKEFFDAIDVLVNPLTNGASELIKQCTRFESTIFVLFRFDHFLSTLKIERSLTIRDWIDRIVFDYISKNISSFDSVYVNERKTRYANLVNKAQEHFVPVTYGLFFALINRIGQKNSIQECIRLLPDEKEPAFSQKVLGLMPVLEESVFADFFINVLNDIKILNDSNYYRNEM